MIAHADSFFYSINNHFFFLPFLPFLPVFFLPISASSSSLGLFIITCSNAPTPTDGQSSAARRPPSTLSRAIPIYRRKLGSRPWRPRFATTTLAPTGCSVPKSQQLALTRIRGIIDHAQSMGTTHLAPVYAADRAGFLLEISARIWLWHSRGVAALVARIEASKPAHLREEVVTRVPVGALHQESVLHGSAAMLVHFICRMQRGRVT